MIQRDLELRLDGTAAALAKLDARRATAERERDEAIVTAAAQGMAPDTIAARVRLTKARVAQIIRAAEDAA